MRSGRSRPGEWRAAPHENPLRLAVFGAAGRADRTVVDHALRQGHEVRALTRDPAAVARTLNGADALVSTLAGSGEAPTSAPMAFGQCCPPQPATARVVSSS
ncbi:NmrA family NAD(P)-binding protein [Actinoplanes sp. NPDC048988]|uniref:NmrA family NAD(P)-binding protein n=1 Tax=Actinoplanes sp. NPDC048988 TaxID=3363901 RepID=UPI003723FE45